MPMKYDSEEIRLAHYTLLWAITKDTRPEQARAKLRGRAEPPLTTADLDDIMLMRKSSYEYDENDNDLPDGKGLHYTTIARIYGIPLEKMRRICNNRLSNMSNLRRRQSDPEYMEKFKQASRESRLRTMERINADPALKAQYAERYARYAANAVKAKAKKLLKEQHGI